VWDVAAGEVKSSWRGIVVWWHLWRLAQTATRWFLDVLIRASVRVWAVAAGEVKVKLEGHSSLVASVAFSTDGHTVVSECLDKREG
jgi:WD40 repeat protein